MAQAYTNLSPAEAEQLAAENPTAMWVDVRTPAEFYQLGHVPGAKLVPHMAIANFIEEIRAHEGPKLVVCEHGMRSQYACQVLAMAGVPEVFNVTGGMSRWQGPRSFDDDAAGEDTVEDTGDETSDGAGESAGER